MLLTEAQQLATKHFKAYGLDDWTFTFDNARQRFGLCNYTYRRISLSRHLVAMNDTEAVEQTILHEVAHAIAGHNAGHGYRWQQVALQLGHTGERCYSDTVKKPEYKYIAKCDCNQVHGRHRLTPLAKYGGYACRKTGKSLYFA